MKGVSGIDKSEYIRNVELKDISQKLEEGIRDVLESREFRKYLSFMGTFHDYSANNIALILKQFPEAKMVAGYYTWNNVFKRHIKRGEKGIRVIMPCPVKVRDVRDGCDNGIVTILRYKVGYVYDVSQTEGRELPRLEINNLSGKVHDYRKLLKAITDTADIPIRFSEISNGANGFYSNREKAIVISRDLSEAHSIKTLIHEMAHHLLHDRDLLMETSTVKEDWEKEIEAESVAYCVCSHFGIDASEYSFKYIAAWAEKREMKEIKKSFEVIRKTSLGLIYGIDRRYTELTRNEEIETIKEVLGKYEYEKGQGKLPADGKELEMRLIRGDTEEITSFVLRRIRDHETSEGEREELGRIRDMLGTFNEYAEKEKERTVER
ncbi:MAG: ImmA/IrrE family metallo-endopeptidase [Clostridia bacterium]|nr:ImmA/IrrE family metallo-endopeptidase [Clostridia bacterium]